METIFLYILIFIGLVVAMILNEFFKKYRITRQYVLKPSLYSIQIRYDTEKEEIDLDIHIVDESQFTNERIVDLNRMLPFKYRSSKRYRDQADSQYAHLFIRGKPVLVDLNDRNYLAERSKDK